jgi:hypothetical protein
MEKETFIYLLTFIAVNSLFINVILLVRIDVINKLLEFMKFSAHVLYKELENLKNQK